MDEHRNRTCLDVRMIFTFEFVLSPQQTVVGQEDDDGALCTCISKELDQPFNHVVNGHQRSQLATPQFLCLPETEWIRIVPDVGWLVFQVLLEDRWITVPLPYRSICIA